MTDPVLPSSDSSEAARPQVVAEQVKTISLYENHKKIYIREAKGWWSSWRWAFVWLTQAIFYLGPWLSWNDRQAILFHLVERKFYIFGLVLWPQDVFYLAVLLIVSAYALFLFTAVAGRLFCGYACPQTVYTEFFMWIENRIEGDRPARMKLDKAPWALRKVGLKTAKHLAWLVVSLWSGFTLVAYFTPVRELLAAFPLALGGWEVFWTLFYAGFMYMQAGFLREQVCKHMCPYARFQGVMYDPDTLVITYDTARGEQRGARKKGIDVKALGLGDCIDCGLCVQVCPTGIDIRNGLQYECIGCGACIDVCDEVMDKTKQPRGLIRYTTENALAKSYTKHDILTHLVRPRVLLYTVGLLAIIVAAAWSLAVRVPLKVDVIRDRSILSREADDGRIENIYTLKIMNTAEQPRRFAIAVGGLEGIALAGETAVDVEGAENKAMVVSVRVPAETAEKGAHKIYFTVRALDQDEVKVDEKATFLMP